MSLARVLDRSFSRLTSEETVEAVMQAIRTNERGVLCTVNVAILMMMRSNVRLNAFVNEARWRVADGQPLVWASRVLCHTPLPERVTGVDLIDLLCEQASKERVGVYLIGASRTTVEKTALILCSRYPDLDIRGAVDGYFGFDEASERAKDIAASGAKLLFVAMGVPRQESFIAEHWHHLGVSVALGVGSSFDVIAGFRKRAPVILQQFGLEWAYRLVQEPRRLARRYLVTNFLFLGLLSLELIGNCLRPERTRHR